ncbi:MAG: hypothetical protein PHC66_01275 [Candidatus Nanoarchaeia archaeon]|nr:hypothetical protein [Candidatus Nanoarchaeia archaeon]MDD5239125.1 hypothetical protein [Candidatus Nanoarchaeia archaeon]
MLVKDFPECFGSYKIYEIVRDTMLHYARDIDVQRMIDAIVADGATPADFLRKLAVHSKRHVNASKASEMIMAIKDKITSLIGVYVEPREVRITKDGSETVRIYVENKMDAMFKFKVGMQQLERESTSLLHDNVKNFSYTKMIKAMPIEAGATHVFKFLIKPDVFGIQDIYELKKNNQVSIMLGMQVAVDGVDGQKTPLHKIPVNIVKAKL